MFTAKQQTGNLGEDLACRFLEKRGYKIKERNYRTKLGEIDIIADYLGQLVFIEVKARSSNYFGYPEEYANKEKMKKVLKAIYQYQKDRNMFELYRVDIIAIELHGALGKATVKHFKDVMY